MADATPPRTAAALAAAAAKECRAAERWLADTRRRHRGVHEARKALRRLKSLLRLGRKAFGASLPGIEARLGRLAAGLSAMRDADVACDVARSLAGPRPAVEWRRALALLTRRSDGLMVEALREDPRFLERRQELRALAGTIAALPWRKVRRAMVERAMTASKRRVEKARKRAVKSPSPDRFHTWRRRARRLRMQLELWRTIGRAGDTPTRSRPHHGKTEIKALSKLSDALGRRRDLLALHEVLRGLRGGERMEPLLARIRAELASLDRLD